MAIVIQFLTAFLDKISSIVGVIWFFLNQSIWTRYISPIVSRKSKPIITFDNGTDVMSVSICTTFNIEGEVKKQINKEIQKGTKRNSGADTSEMKKLPGVFKNSFEEAEENISEPEVTTIKIIMSVKQNKKN